MRKISVMVSLIFAFMTLSSVAVPENARPALFASAEEKNEFVSVVSVLIEKTWKKWQDAVIINDVDVEGPRGMIKPGDMVEPLFESSEMLKDFDRTGKSQEYIDCVRAVAKALENGMRNWQLGYTNDNVPFPQGVSCTFTLTPCDNVPVIIGLGQSTGDSVMKADALYNFMLYRTPDQSEDTLMVMHAVSSGIAEGFEEWKRACSIVGIVASGGIAPQPGPMGTGPGPVRGAKGNNGKLIGHYFNGEHMRERAAEYFLARNGGEGTGTR